MCPQDRTFRKAPVQHAQRPRRAIRVLYALTAIALSALVAAPAASAAPMTATATAAMVAPAGTAEIWVDVESTEAAATVTEIQLRPITGSAVSALPVATPFGASAAFLAGPGEVSLFLKLSGRLSADIALTFADGEGHILDAALMNRVSVDPAQADADGWVPVQRSDGEPPAPPQPADPDAGGDGKPSPLTRTGADASVLLIAAFGGGLLLIGGATIAVIAERRRRNALQDTTTDAEGTN